MIVDTISPLELELDRNRRSNLEGLKSESSTYQLVGPHRLSLHYNMCILLTPLKLILNVKYKNTGLNILV